VLVGTYTCLFLDKNRVEISGGFPDVGHPLVMAPECEASLNFTYDDPLWLPADTTKTAKNLKEIGHRSAY
jgi:hypothetical protein